MNHRRELRFKKSAQVFWVMVNDEILLRNYATNVAIQLDPERRRVWELLDGAHTQEEIVHKLKKDSTSTLSREEVADLVQTLEANGFLSHA